MALVLAVDMAGVPSRWLMVEEAISYYARRMVSWSIGDPVATYRGGMPSLLLSRPPLHPLRCSPLHPLLRLSRPTLPQMH